MAYRFTYSYSVDWIGPGMGPVSAGLGVGNVAGGNAQSLTLFNKAGGQNIQGTGAGGALAAADITALTNAAAADMVVQLNAQPTLGQLQGWPTGNP